jgi:ring-1,2-phenylacetyl-CoA epoxidase subunit PaaC
MTTPKLTSFAAPQGGAPGPSGGRAGPTAASIGIQHTPQVDAVLRLADTALIHAQRLCEWSGHAPIIEEDIALSNMGLDLLGQARALLTHAGRLEGSGLDEDQLAFLRDERDFRNLTMAELPRGDFAFTMLRSLFLATWFKLLWERLADDADAELAGIAAKAVKEARYHQQHAADWVVRLADGTDESRRRIDAALAELWRQVPELFECDPAREGQVREAWEAEIAAVFADGGLSMPAHGAWRGTASRGVHTEHMGYLLAEMQHLQRAFPGGVW